jgi:hypothetical protein
MMTSKKRGAVRRYAVLLLIRHEKNRLLRRWLKRSVDEREAVSWRATQALLDEGCSDAPGVVQALVRVGLGSEGLRATASDQLQRLRQDARLDLSIKGALLDGLRSESHIVATASALLLIDIGEAHGEARVARITKAILRDSKQVPNALPRLQYLLGQQMAGAVVKAIGEYIGGKDVDAQTASACAQLMVEADHLNTPHLAKTLVLSGLADESSHDVVITYIVLIRLTPPTPRGSRSACPAPASRAHFGNSRGGSPMRRRAVVTWRPRAGPMASDAPAAAVLRGGSCRDGSCGGVGDVVTTPP